MSAPTLVPEATCYYLHDGIPKGPVSEEELASLLADGTLKDQGQVRTPRASGWQTCDEWRTLRDQPELPPSAPTPAAAAPPAPAAPSAPAAAVDARHACVGCGKDWPESLMLMDARQWRCRPCFQKLSLKAKRTREKRSGNWMKAVHKHRKRVSIVILTVLALTGLAWHYRAWLAFGFFDSDGAPEPWAKLPPAQWPALVFTNQADFRGHSSLKGQGVFFTRRGDGNVVAVTAAHLLTADVGVVPDMAPNELDARLRAWWAYPPGAPDQAVALAGLYGSPAAWRGFDLVLLTVAPDAKTGGITPLRVASRDTRDAERVFVVVPAAPADPKSTAARQSVFPGLVRIRANGEKGGPLLDVRMDGSHVPRDFSGCPVVNVRGRLVGLVKGWSDPINADGYVSTVFVQGGKEFRDLVDLKTEPSKAGQN